MSDLQLKRVENGNVAVSGELSFKTAKRALGQLLPLLQGDKILVDLAGVERADSAGLALLVEWMRLSKENGVQLFYRRIPAQMLAIARVSGLDNVLPIELD